MNVLLKRFHFNGQTTGFYPQTDIVSPQIQFINAVNGKEVLTVINLRTSRDINQ